MPLRLEPWDLILIVVVSLHATVMAYVYDPKWKAFTLTLPIPFTVACLAVGRPVDATNVLGLILLLLFTHVVRLLHCDLHVPIVPSIVVAALGYCFVGSWLTHLPLHSDAAFWMGSAGTLILSSVMLGLVPHREEPGHRTPLPAWIKLPLIVAVIVFLVVLKESLHGFMTTFPMVGVIAAYETRRSLWTTCRQIPVLMFTMTLMMIVCRLTQQRMGLGVSLLLAWAVLLLTLIPLTRYLWTNGQAVETGSLEGPIAHENAQVL